MKRYMQSFLVTGIIMSVIGAQLLLVGLVTINIPQILITGVFLSLWWFAYASLQKDRKGSLAFSLITILIPWGYFLSNLFARRAFVIKNHGFERADGYGSPMAFWIGLIFDVFCFAVLSVIATQGVAAILERRKRQQPEAILPEDMPTIE